MTTTAHTPGLWSYNRDEGGMHGHVISTGDYIICELPDAGDGATPHTEADARLIAASPALLKAALLVIARWHPHTFGLSDQSGQALQGFGENTLWIITEADRSATTFQVPDDY